VEKALIRVCAEMESCVGKQLLADIYKETGFDPTKP
jgi:hypothetical protein